MYCVDTKLADVMRKTTSARTFFLPSMKNKQLRNDDLYRKEQNKDASLCTCNANKLSFLHNHGLLAEIFL